MKQLMNLLKKIGPEGESLIHKLGNAGPALAGKAIEHPILASAGTGAGLLGLHALLSDDEDEDTKHYKGKC